MTTQTVTRLSALAFAAVMATLVFGTSTPASGAGAWIDNGATACGKFLTPDVLASILRNPAGRLGTVDAHTCNFGPIYITLSVANINVFRQEIPRIAGAHPISGFGDAAFWNEAGAFSSVKGNRGCNISVIDPPEAKIHNAELGQKFGDICNKLFALP